MKKALTGHPNMLKEVNKGLIKSALQRLQTATRVELCAETKISQPTVNAIINELLAENVVIENGVAKSSGGRKAVLYSLNSKLCYIASIVVEEHELQYAITDIDGKIIKDGFIEHENVWSIQELDEQIKEIVSLKKNVRALAIGVPGAVSKCGMVSAIPKVECLEGFQLKKHLEELLDVTVSLSNDINTVALGYFSEESKSNKEYACIHIGNTLGAGMIIGGQMVSGAGNFAGEIGFMQTDPEIRTKELSIKEMGYDDIILVVSKIMINTICLINPEVIAIGGKKINADICGVLRQNCMKALPEQMLPEIIYIEDERKYYLEGLSKVGVDSMNPAIMLVRQNNV